MSADEVGGNLLLDTCAVLWLTGGDERRLSASARQAIDTASTVYVSSISAWEIALKTARGLLDLPLPPLEWFAEAIRLHGLTERPLTTEVLVRSTLLPEHHRDPADRFIIATAMLDNLSIITSDRRFDAYGVSVLS